MYNNGIKMPTSGYAKLPGDNTWSTAVRSLLVDFEALAGFDPDCNIAPKQENAVVVRALCAAEL